MRKTLFVIITIAITFFQTSKIAYSNEWVDAGIDRNHLTKFYINNEECNKSISDAAACIHMLNKLASFSEKKTVTINPNNSEELIIFKKDDTQNEKENHKRINLFYIKSINIWGNYFKEMIYSKPSALEDEAHELAQEKLELLEIFDRFDPDSHSSNDFDLTYETIYELNKLIASKGSILVNFESIFNHYSKDISLKEMNEVAIELIQEFFILKFFDHSRPGISKIIDEKMYEEESVEGIGIVLNFIKSNAKINEVIENGPSFMAGLKKGDLILSIDGEKTDEMKIDDISNKLRGKIKTKVKLKIQRKKEIFIKTIVRDKIIFKNVISRMIKKQLYIKLNNFIKIDSSEKIKEHIEKNKEKGIEGIILDLRGNPGGFLYQAVEIADLFLPEKKLVTTLIGLSGNQVQNKYTENDIYYKYPLSILIDYESASASEVLSGALQNNKRALIVGEKSFGKGTAQGISLYSEILNEKIPSTPPEEFFHFEEEDHLSTDFNFIRDYKSLYLYLTTGRLHFSNGSSHQLVGVSPDYPILSEEDKAQNENKMREIDYAFNPIPPSLLEPPERKIPKEISECADELISQFDDTEVDIQLKAAEAINHCSTDLYNKDGFLN